MPYEVTGITFDSAPLKKLIFRLKLLNGPQFEQKVASIIEEFAFHSKLHIQIRALIIALIYAVHPENPKQKRTYQLLNSFFTHPVTADDGDISTIATYVDPSISESLDQGFSYATFFERPQAGEFGKGTFIKPRGVARSPVNYRPFVGQIEKLLLLHVPEQGRKAFTETIAEILEAKLGTR